MRPKMGYIGYTMFRASAIIAAAVLALPVRGADTSSVSADTSRATVSQPAPVPAPSRAPALGKAVSVPKPKTNWSRIKELFM